MAKFRPAGKRAKTAKSNARAIPCMILIVLGIAMLCLLFYFSLKSST
jgi:hypothetical protein